MTTDDSRAVPDTEVEREALDWFGSDPSATELPLTDTDQRYAVTIVRAALARDVPTNDGCTCLPCTTPGRGHPTIEHCAACCSGSGIEEYDHNCPVAEHRVMAARQFPPALARDVPAGRDLTAQDVAEAFDRWHHSEDPADDDLAAAHLTRIARGDQ